MVEAWNEFQSSFFSLLSIREFSAMVKSIFSFALETQGVEFDIARAAFAAIDAHACHLPSALSTSSRESKFGIVSTLPTKAHIVASSMNDEQ